ncbi:MULTISPECIES: hypothetical protein [unclassified Streptomyces]|uniref:hypothetical protein n=1 Tax=unclassified Streptomyces TaxID=2593676 RepID=UPI0006FC61E9|nr:MULTISPECIES: hypothetical protein [unclassified Streptomyces]KQX47700.1 hypothetical protein ASD33_18295 [Streptomyces sp. Root1304]KRA94945.1 hypothetical protein ASE09_29600 [Streptomyces sp. Root66D1]
MILIALTAVLALVAGGCVCVVWAARGGPRWVRGVAAVTLTAGQLVRSSNRRRGVGGGGDDGGGDD